MDQLFFLNTTDYTCPQIIDSADAKSETTLGLFSMLKPTFVEGFLDETKKEQRWIHVFANSAWYGSYLRNA
jgi:hypothetical protein